MATATLEEQVRAFKGSQFEELVVRILAENNQVLKAIKGNTNSR